MVITILMPEFIFSKAICDLRLALKDLREFDEKLQGGYKHVLKWSVCSKGIQHTWTWQVDYGIGARLSYWILGLQPPLSRNRPIEKIAEHGDNDLTEEIAGQDQPQKSRRKYMDQTPPELSEYCRYHTTQSWTITHAYFANMGGLVYSHHWSFCRSDRLAYYVLFGDNLSNRFKWHFPHAHPLRGLVLSKEDIEDRSKADWLLKGLAVLQITWLVLTVLIRGVVGLPVTQLEIATLAFSVFAIATYAASWRKPKDVSRPIILQDVTYGSQHKFQDPMTAFTQYLLHPVDAATARYQYEEQNRIRNDMFWIEEGVPLIFSIMAFSALVFGGLHCLAWNFEFPTRAELVLWRASSLTSMILPLSALALSFCLIYSITTYHYEKQISFLLGELKPLRAFHEGFRELLKEPQFRSWDLNAQIILASMPTGSRNFEEKPPEEPWPLVREGTWRKYKTISAGIRIFFDDHQKIVSRLETAGKGERPANVSQDLRTYFLHIRKHTCEEVLDFLDDFEDYLRKKCTAYDTSIPETRYMRHFVKVGEEFKKDIKRHQVKQDIYTRVSRFLTISSGIIYVASRLIIITLLFTSLRAVPESVYEVTPWTRFLPNIS